jgi:hypothetical protein
MNKNTEPRDIQWKPISGEQLQKQVAERCRKSAALKLAAAAKIESHPLEPLKPEQPKREVKKPKLGDVIIESDIDSRGREVNKRVRIFGLK